MAFDIETEKAKLDRFLTWAALKYEMYDAPWEFALEDKILDTYNRYMATQITKQNKLGAAKQAFFANIRFCENFGDYLGMHWDYFTDDPQYWPWRQYCVDELELFQTDETETWDIDNNGELITTWEKPIIGCFFEASKKYITWTVKPETSRSVSLEELGMI